MRLDENTIAKLVLVLIALVLAMLFIGGVM